MLTAKVIDKLDHRCAPLLLSSSGDLSPDQLWKLEYRGAGITPAMRLKNIEGIGYIDDNKVVDSQGAILDLHTQMLVATNICGPGTDPVPLYFKHESGEVPTAILGPTGPLPVGSYLLETSPGVSIYLADAGSYRAVYADSRTRSLELRPVIQGWPLSTEPYIQNALRLRREDSFVRGYGSFKSKAFELFSAQDGKVRTVQIYNDIIRFFTNGILELELTDEDVTVGELKARLEKIPGWRVDLKVPRRTKINFPDKTILSIYVDPEEEEPGDPELPVAIGTTGLLVEIAAIFYKSFVREPFLTSIDGASTEDSWGVRIAPGHFLSNEYVGPDLLASWDTPLDFPAGSVISPWVTAEWRVTQGANNTKLGQSFDAYGLADLYTSVDAFLGAPQTAVNRLIPHGGNSRTFRSPRRLIVSVDQVWIGDKEYPPSIFEHVDLTEGIFTTSVGITEQIKIKYQFRDDTLSYTGFTNPITGQWEQLEMNPRYQPENVRYSSVCILLLPASVTMQVTPPDAAAFTHTIVNPAPLRFVYTSEPRRFENTVRRSPATAIGIGPSLSINLPYRMLAIYHYSPLVSREDLLSIDRQGGKLRRDLTEEQIKLKSPDAYGWILQEKGLASQLNQTLAISVDRSVLNKYTEEEVRRKVAKFLPASTFFDIVYY